MERLPDSKQQSAEMLSEPTIADYMKLIDQPTPPQVLLVANSFNRLSLLEQIAIAAQSQQKVKNTQQSHN
ncbi:hypothetical protein [Agarivorans sp. QJM3NY_33]|uniref:hypothetical protein n=1 Tax=Agarivorans sp. QJM3NY_33 TaxID=3421432 RepID=UPI003D7E7C29